MKRSWRTAVVGTVVAVLALAGLHVGSAAASQHPYCGQAWGSLPKQLGNYDPGGRGDWVVGARSGRHTCFDRLVFDLTAPASGYRVAYVPEVRQDGSGTPVPLRGGAFLSIELAAAAYDENGQPTYSPPDRNNVVDVRGYATFRQVAFAGSFEGTTKFGLGVRTRLPFRVVVLAGPGTGSRVVVDVSHRWV